VLSEIEITTENLLKNQEGHISESDSYLIDHYGGKTIFDILKSLTTIRISENLQVTVYTCKKDKNRSQLINT
jgi:hypothetical protein